MRAEPTGEPIAMATATMATRATISFDNDFDKYFDDAMAYLTGGDPNKE